MSKIRCRYCGIDITDGAWCCPDHEVMFLRARVVELEELLKPFADVGVVLEAHIDQPGIYIWKRQSNVRDEPGITAGDCRRAALALGREIAERRKG